MVPYCRKLIDESLLTEEEKGWINDYHKDIYNKTNGYFPTSSIALAWLERETRPI
jgi:Xaa-Pro aminopeptidase